jgi:hypothetical protein
VTRWGIVKPGLNLISFFSNRLKRVGLRKI